MGSLFRAPSPPPSPPPVVTAEPPAVPPARRPDREALERKRRLEEIARRQRGRASTVLTSPRGLLLLSDNAPQRRSLLGE